MPNNNEEVMYSFNGDSSGLQRASQEAISYLDTYEKALQKSGKADNFAPVLSDIQHTIEGIKGITGAISSLPKSDIQNMTGLISQLTLSLKGMSYALSMPSNVTSGTFNALYNSMLNMSKAVNEVVAPVTHLTTNLQSSVGMMETSNQAMNNGSTISQDYSNALMSVAMSAGSLATITQAAGESTKQSSQKAKSGKINWDELYKSIQQLAALFENIKFKLLDISGGFDKISSSLSSVNSLLKTLLGIDVASYLSQSAIQAMNYVENLNLFNVAMGDSIEYGKEFVSQMQEIYGLDPSNIMTYVGTFHQLTSAIEMPTEQADIMSVQLTKLSTDIASVFNMDVNKVINNMTSGIMGMSRAVAKYGMDIRVSTLQQTALSLGITENVRNMSEANREGLRYITMVRQASNLSGDWAKTIESPANQLRILKEQLTQLARAIGNLILPTITKVLPYINGFVMALREAINAIAEFFGYSDMDFGGSTSTIEDTTGALEDVGAQADETAKKLKALKAPFDELNVLQDNASDSSSTGDATNSEIMDPAIAQAIAALQVPMENVRMKANEVRDAILGFMNLKGGTFQSVLEKIRKLFQELVNICTILKNKAKEALSFNDNGAKILENIKGILSDIYDWIMRIIADTKDWASNLNLEPLVSAFAYLSEALRLFLNMIGDELESIYQNVILPIGKKLIEDILPDIITKIADILKYLGDHPEVAQVLLSIAGAIGTIVLAIKGASVIIGIVQSISSGLSVLSGAISAVAAATGLANWQVTLIMIAIVAVIAIIILVVTHLDEIKEWLQTNFPELYKVLSGAVAFIKGLLSGLWTWVKGIFKNSLDYVLSIFEDIFVTIKDVFKDLLNFIDAVFAGDWERALKSLGNIVIDILNGVIRVVLDGVNWVLGIIETLVNSVGSAAASIGESFGKDWGWTVSMSIDSSKLQIPKLATGAVVSRPTLAMIGEGNYNEAVVPLGNSPQLNEMLNKFAEKVGTNNQPTEVRVFIGDTEWDTFTYKSAQRGAKKLGAPVIGGNTRA